MEIKIIKPIEFIGCNKEKKDDEIKRFRLPIKFETEGCLSVDVYAADIKEAISTLKENIKKYVSLPPDDTSPSAYINLDAILDNGKAKVGFTEEEEEQLVEFFEFNETVDPDFKKVSYFDCSNFNLKEK